ncbi:MAG: tRNA lysidine(34) synthetase TilS [bacterium]
MTPAFIEAVLHTIRRERLLSPGDAVVVGFSGGADSSALLRALLDLEPKLGLRVVAAHLDHGLRAESEEDAEFARGRAQEWNVPFVGERIDWTPRGGVPRANVESAARAVRYEFLRRVGAERGGVVAVGHHADDRIETFLAQWLRGAGPRGLSSPRYRREDGVVRPLLDRTRAEIEEYLSERGIPWRSDPTNDDGSNLRSRLRRDVVPALLRESPELARSAGRTASLLSDVEEVLEERAREVAALLRRHGAPGELVLDGPSGRPYHRLVLSTILRNAIRDLAPASEAGYEPLERLVRAWKSGSREVVDVSGGVRVSVGEERVIVSGRSGAQPVAEREIPVPGSLLLEGLEARLQVDEVSPPPSDARGCSDAGVAWLDAGEVRRPLRVRARRPGDRYHPLGLSGTAKVQDLMVDRKIPRRLRDVVPLVVDDRGILWIPGFRVDARTRITDTTHRALRLEITGRLPWLAEAGE